MYIRIIGKKDRILKRKNPPTNKRIKIPKLFSKNLVH